MSNLCHRWPRVAVTAVGLLFGAAALAAADYPATTAEGLERNAASRFDAFYWRPDVDLQAYSQIMIAEEIPVEFRADWQRDQNRLRGAPNDVEESDAERIRGMMADSLRHVLTRELAQRGDYPVVTAPAGGVLLLKPAIVDLDVFAPDIFTPNITRVFTQMMGRMTLQMDLYDAQTNELVGRIIDRQSARDQRFLLRFTNRVTNRVESEIIMRRWGARLRNMLDEARA
jgi:hypothetical protein